jgi:DNA-binding response OmpR family regulator
MRLLIVEDELRLSDSLKKGLTEAGYAVDQAFDGEEGQYLAESETYDAILLDLMLPKVDGLTICRELRRKKIVTPILMLTAKGRTDEKVAGLNIGADDYLTKPFELTELLARISALVRRNSGQKETVLRIGNLMIDTVGHKVKRGNRQILLTPKEFSILELLAIHPDEVFSRTSIIEHTWDYNFSSMSNVVDVFITSLRRKIDHNEHQKLLHTVHGVGYKLSETP